MCLWCKQQAKSEPKNFKYDLVELFNLFLCFLAFTEWEKVAKQYKKAISFKKVDETCWQRENRLWMWERELFSLFHCEGKELESSLIPIKKQESDSSLWASSSSSLYHHHPTILCFLCVYTLYSVHVLHYIQFFHFIVITSRRRNGKK